ncbi:MAG: hypothetical protein KDA51_00875 [Planctomycetales bacterium]|nr:hypothetical protein [Planctomycetales bacterium]
MFSDSMGQITGVFDGTSRPLSNSRGGDPGNGDSGRPMSPGDGTTVLLDSTATNLLDSPDGNGEIRDIVAMDLSTGSTDLITISPSGQPANGDSFGPWGNSFGLPVVGFWSLATNLSDEPVGGSDALKMGTTRQALVSAFVGGGATPRTLAATSIPINLETATASMCG